MAGIRNLTLWLAATVLHACGPDQSQSHPTAPDNLGSVESRGIRATLSRGAAHSSAVTHLTAAEDEIQGFGGIYRRGDGTAVMWLKRTPEGQPQRLEARAQGWLARQGVRGNVTVREARFSYRELVRHYMEIGRASCRERV